MNKKLIIQLILSFIIVLFVSLFYFQYISKENTKITEKQEDTNLNLKKESSNNIIENIKYVVDDKFGNKYLITAEYGEILEENASLILLENVKAILKFDNREEITIKASSALYNILDYDTNFKKNVFIDYGEHKMNCDYIDLLFKEQKIKLYDNVRYNNLNTNLLADKMEIDLFSKNTKIYMKDANKKIKIIYKDNGNY